MNNKYVVWRLVAAVMMIAGCGDNRVPIDPDASPPPDAGPTLVTMSGRVLDGARVPIMGADISINGVQAVTGALGDFDIELTPAER